MNTLELKATRTPLPEPLAIEAWRANPVIPAAFLKPGAELPEISKERAVALVEELITTPQSEWSPELVSVYAIMFNAPYPGAPQSGEVWLTSVGGLLDRPSWR